MGESKDDKSMREEEYLDLKPPMECKVCGGMVLYDEDGIYRCFKCNKIYSDKE